MTHASLFSGIGGFDLAAEWAGWTNAFNCEIDPFCRKVLKYHFPMQNLWLLSKIGCNSLLHIGLFATNERHFDVRVTDG